MKRPFRPQTRLIIVSEIEEKIIHKHGLEISFVRELFRKYQWQARLVQPKEGEPPWIIPRYIVEPTVAGRSYRLIFAMVHPPGTEAFLITCFDPEEDEYPNRKDA